MKDDRSEIKIFGKKCILTICRDVSFKGISFEKLRENGDVEIAWEI